MTGAEAANAVELASAILLSSASGRALSLPLDRGRYETFIRSKLDVVES